MVYEDVMNRLQALADPEAVAGMAKFAVGGQHTLGISIPTLRRMAKEIGRNHELAQQLWASGIHEARILATLIDSPKQVSEAQMEAWVAHQTGCHRRAQLCQKGGQLGLTANRQAEPQFKSGSYSSRLSNSEVGIEKRPLDCRGRFARADG